MAEPGFKRSLSSKAQALMYCIVKKGEEMEKWRRVRMSHQWLLLEPSCTYLWFYRKNYDSIFDLLTKSPSNYKLNKLITLHSNNWNNDVRWLLWDVIVALEDFKRSACLLYTFFLIKGFSPSNFWRKGIFIFSLLYTQQNISNQIPINWNYVDTRVFTVKYCCYCVSCKFCLLPRRLKRALGCFTEPRNIALSTETFCNDGNVLHCAVWYGSH